MVNQVFPPGKLMDGAKELAHRSSSMNPAALIADKLTIDAIQDLNFWQALRYADIYHVALGEVTEAARAFSEKH